MKRTNWPVADYGIRPAGKPDHCFYCKQPLGAQHAEGCVIRSRTVLVRTIVTHAIDVPENWDVSNIEFTEGSSCSDNLIRQLEMLSNRLSEKEHCTCGLVRREYVREALPEDEERSQLFVENMET